MRPHKPAGKIVKPLETPRLTAASTGVSREMGAVLNNAGATWEPRLLAGLYAAAALEADDAYAEEHDLICQHYGIRKTDLTQLIALAASGLAGQHQIDTEHGDCPGCRNPLFLGRVRAAVEWTSAPGWKHTRPAPD